MCTIGTENSLGPDWEDELIPYICRKVDACGMGRWFSVSEHLLCT